MKKTLIMLVVGALIVTVGFTAYAHYEDYSRGRGMMNSPRGGGKMYGRQSESSSPQGGMMYGNGRQGGRMNGNEQQDSTMYGKGRQGGRMYGNEQQGSTMYGKGRQGGKMRGGRGGGMYAQGQQMQGRGRGGRWNSSVNATCRFDSGNGRLNRSQQQQTTAPEMLNEEKVKETAQEYLGKYLSGYSIDKVEKDDWRPLYTVTVKGENDAVQKMVVHGFSGQIMHVAPEETATAAE